MSLVAILGAGPIGAATAERLARRATIRGIRLIDTNPGVAAGKALDLLQSNPIARADVEISSAADPLAAAAADVIVVADDTERGEWTGDAGLSLIQHLARAGSSAPFVFAGPAQTRLLEQAAREAAVPADRLVGSGASAVASSVQSLAGLELGLASIELTVVGRPPDFVIGWAAASVAGALVTDRVPPHRLLTLSRSLPRLWPPGPFATGAATSRIVEALVLGARELLPALTVTDHGFGPPGTAVMLPLELGRLRVLSHVVPSLSPQERTAVVRSLG